VGIDEPEAQYGKMAVFRQGKNFVIVFEGEDSAEQYVIDYHQMVDLAKKVLNDGFDATAYG
jgi:hypothetical protein